MTEFRTVAPGSGHGKNAPRASIQRDVRQRYEAWSLRQGFGAGMAIVGWPGSKGSRTIVFVELVPRSSPRIRKSSSPLPIEESAPARSSCSKSDLSTSEMDVGAGSRTVASPGNSQNSNGGFCGLEIPLTFCNAVGLVNVSRLRRPGCWRDKLAGAAEAESVG